MQIEIGKIVNTHGIKGELKVYSTTDFEEERFAKGCKVNLHYGKEMLEMEVATYRTHKGFVLVSFKGLQDINLVEKYKGCQLSVDSESLPELEEDEVYFYQLVGCKVMENDDVIGEVSEILETEAHDILRVKRENDKDVLIPYVDTFIEDVDTDENIIYVHLIEGML